MPNQSRFMTMPRILAGLAVALVLSLAAGDVHARDMVEYGRYLGVRLQMWEESYEVLDKIIDSGSADEKARARRNKAEVMKAEADAIYSEDQDDSARTARYGKALAVFGDPDDPAGVVAKGVMQLDLALALRRTDPDAARGYCDDAIKMLNDQRVYLDEKVRFQNPATWDKVYPDYSRLYYHFCRGYYVKGMTYESGSGDREANFKLCERNIGEFLFSLDYPTEEQVLTYPLLGDIEIARGHPEAAVAQFTGCVSFLKGEAATDYLGRLALEHGYLRAAELLTTELDYDPKNLEKCVDLYTEAYTKYGQIPELNFQFKRFQLYRISALIKLGDEAKVRGAIDQLFKLAADRDVTFRRQALVVLADIATRDNLDNELRFKCAGMVYAELDTNPVSVILKNIQAYQSLIVACKDAKTFETYAPACFTRIGEMYSRMWRFLDAALVYREACYRTLYFAEKFGPDDTVPDHMKDRCALIKDGKSLNNFPAEMSNLFARHAGFLVHKDLGEPNNKFFQKLSSDADQLKAELAGKAAKMELAYKSANELYRDKKFHQAAVRMVSLPAEFRSYHIALYIGAKAYFNVSEDPNAPRHNRRGEQDKDNYKWDIEDAEWYAAQRARHAADLGSLPASLYDGVEKSHWDAIVEGSTADQLANWHKAVYYYKKYFLFEAKKAWDEISPVLEGKERPGIADAIGAIAEVRNAKWLRDNPSGKGEPDADMKRMGFAAYDLAYLLRNPPRKLDDATRAALLEAERPLALGILAPYWKWFGSHLADSPNYKQGSLRLSFGALSESRDEDACEEVYRAYIESFPDDTAQIKYMVSNLYAILREKLTPKTSAMALASSKLVSYSNLLKKNSFERINGGAKDADGNPLPGFADDEKRLNEAKGLHQKRMILAEHFWQRWMLEQFLDAERNQELREFLPDLKDAVEQKWKAMAEEYPQRWAKAVRAEYDTQMKKDSFKPVKDELTKALAGVTDYEIVDKIKAVQDAEAAKQGGDGAKIALLADLLAFITVSTDALAYFTGTIFIYDLGGFLEKLAQDVDERARPSTTRILKYYEEYRMQRGQGGMDSLTEKDVKLLGKQYFRIRDWANTVKYLGNYVERFGGDRAWGKETEVPVDQRSKRIGKTSSGNELEIKYMLGTAYLELFKEGKDVENLKKSALLMRRCWCFNLVRDANEVGGKQYNWVKSTNADDTDLQKAIEDYYLYVGRTMAEIFLLLHGQKDVKIAWPAYADQYTKSLEPKKEGDKVVTQGVPADAAGCLWHASQIHLRIWASFKLLGAYQFRGEFRENLESWLKLSVRWLQTYGDKDMGIEELKGAGVTQQAQGAYDVALSESSLEATYLPDEMKQYLARLKDYAKQLEKVCKEKKIDLKTA
ncbi:MAG: hypothetical protein ICCCNLDF_00460 [Planctomycetes bacterium]|nr:hypothetical protein [Planctomycetota bacterium]